MTTKNLLKSFLSKSNFISAYRRIASRKAVGGIDGASVEAFGLRLDRNIDKLLKEISERRYIPQPATVTYIPKYNEKREWRELGLPSVADKVVQAALLQVVEPIAEKMFLDCSYAYRPHKGHYKAIRRVEHCLNNRKKTWVMHRDIYHFFDTLDHDLLINQFSELVNREPVLTELVALWCKMGLVEKDGMWRNVETGTRQGNVISPILSNIYLHTLDKFATSLPTDWIRYADDYLLFGNTAREVVDADIRIAQFLKDTLHLKLKDETSLPGHINDGFSFLGIRFCNKDRSIDPEKVEKMKRKIQWALSKKRTEPPEEIIMKLREIAQGWRLHYGFIHPLEQFSQINEFLEDEFVRLAGVQIKGRHWSLTPPGVPFPSLFTDIERDGIRKTKYLWKKAIGDQKEGDVTSMKRTVEVKISRKRRNYKREFGMSGNLVVTTPGYFIGKRGEMIIVRNKQKIVNEMPVIRLKGLTLIDRGTSISGDAIELCMKNELYIHFVDSMGKIVGMVRPPEGVSGEVSLLQITERDKERGLMLAKMFVLGKIKNQFALLKCYYKYPLNRENGFGKKFIGERQYLETLIKKVKEAAFPSETAMFRAQLMGLEGSFGAAYWSLIGHLFRNGVVFSGRIRYGAKDVVNAALNYGYGILYGECLNATLKAGLNPMAGFLHSYQSGKPTLIYDLIEEFRPFTVDRGIFALFNRREKLEMDKEYLLTPEARKKIAKCIISHLSSEVWFRGKEITICEAIQEQAYNIKKHLLNTAQYRPFLCRW